MPNMENIFSRRDRRRGDTRCHRALMPSVRAFLSCVKMAYIDAISRVFQQ